MKDLRKRTNGLYINNGLLSSWSSRLVEVEELKYSTTNMPSSLNCTMTIIPIQALYSYSIHKWLNLFIELLILAPLDSQSTNQAPSGKKPFTSFLGFLVFLLHHQIFDPLEKSCLLLFEVVPWKVVPANRVSHFQGKSEIPWCCD